MPGEVLDTNGDAEAGTVSWTFTPGEVGDVNAVVVGRRPERPVAGELDARLAARSSRWPAAAVVLLARRTRNPPVRRRRGADRSLPRIAAGAARPSRCTSSAVAVDRFSV